MARKHKTKDIDSEQKPKRNNHINNLIKAVPSFNPWKIAAVILSILFLASIFGGFSFDKKVSEKEAKEKTEDFLNNLMAGQATATINDISKDKGLYKIKLDIDGMEYDSYVTKDGELLFPQAMDMSGNSPAAEDAPAQNTQPAQQDIPKSDKPQVDLFVMSHCPYGTQAEKGMIPAVKALGDSIDFNLRFVYYVMHGEVEIKEQINQYCIQKEQKEKLLPYLECFLEAGDGKSCLAEAEIDLASMDACVNSADAEFKVTENLNDKSSWLNGRYPLFNTDADLNQKYGIGGSPSLVINGEKSSAGRDSASYLKAICGAFSSEPSACSQQLSSTSPSPGFGYSITGSASATAECDA